MRPLLVLRPEPGASATVRRAEAMGLVAQAHPIFALEPLPWRLPEGRFDGLVLTSANAVRLAGALPDLPVHAVGEATAAVARAAGAKVVTVGRGGVDALLAEVPVGLRLLHLAGEDRIEPSAPGPDILAVPVYRAQPLPLPPPEVLQGRVLLIHSPAAGRRLASIDGPRSTMRLAAISPAAASACGSGWERIAVAERPSDEALLSLAAELCKD